MDDSGPSSLPAIGDRSYGIIPLRLIPGLPETTTPLRKDTVQVLLIHQKTLDQRNPSFWCFPKGHPEVGDASLVHTALRELEEETGLCLETVDILADEEGEHSSKVSFTERYQNPIRKVGKEVRYWVGVLKGVQAKREIKVQAAEVIEAGWFGWKEGMERITFEEGREMLRKVGELLENRTKGKGEVKGNGIEKGRI